MKLKPEKKSGLNGIRTHDLCDTGAVLCQLRYHANWEVASSHFVSYKQLDEPFTVVVSLLVILPFAIS